MIGYFAESSKIFMCSSYSSMTSIKPAAGNFAKVKHKKTFIPVSPLPGLFSEPIQIRKIKKVPHPDDPKVKHNNSTSSSSRNHKNSVSSVKRNIFSAKEKLHSSSEKASATSVKGEKLSHTAAVVSKDKHKHSSSKEEKPKSEKKIDHIKKPEHVHKRKHDEQRPLKVAKESVHSNKVASENVSEPPKILEQKHSNSSTAKSSVYIYSGDGETSSAKIVFEEDKSNTATNPDKATLPLKCERRHSVINDNVFDNIMNSDDDQSENVIVNKVMVSSESSNVESEAIQSRSNEIIQKQSSKTPKPIKEADFQKTTISFTDEEMPMIVSEPSTVVPTVKVEHNEDESSPTFTMLSENLSRQDSQTMNIDLTPKNEDRTYSQLKRKHSDSSVLKHKHKKHKRDREHKHSSEKHKHKHKKHKHEKLEVEEKWSKQKYHLSPKVELDPDVVVKNEKKDSHFFVKKENASPNYFPDSSSVEKDHITDDLPAKVPRIGVIEFSYGQALSSDVDIVNKFPFASPEFRKYVHVETDPNGEASVLHAYQHEIAELNPIDRELFAKDFCTLCFQETNTNEADFVMGIVHGAASYMPDYLEYLSEEQPHLRVKTEVLGQRDILTMSVKEFREQVCRTYSRESGMYRYCIFHIQLE